MVRRLHHYTILACLALAFASLGFGHAPARADQVALQAAAFTFGADICGKGTAPHAGAACEACRIAKAADLPGTTALPVRIPGGLAADPLRPAAVHSAAATGAHPARAPPV
ncbi:MAG: hypothetical protein AAFY59_05900 [Pseudomonadota bacterium]